MKLTGYVTGIMLILSSSFIANAQWSLSGNASTNPSTNFLGTTDAQPVVFKTNNTEIFRLSATDNTLSMSAPIRMNNNALYFGSTAADPYYYIQNTGWDQGMKYIHYTSHQFFTNSGEKMRILQNGNVGIGTTTPGYKLTVKATFPGVVPSEADGIRIISDGTVTSELVATRSTYNWAGVGGNEIWLLSSNGDLNVGPATTTHNLKFMTGQAERMRISSAGNVGIGTITPADKLDVNGNVRSSGNAFIGSSSIVSNGSRLIVAGGATPTATAYNLGLNFYSGAAGRLITGGEAGSATGVITNLMDASNMELSAGTASTHVSGVTISALSAAVAPGTVRLWTTGTERFRIASNGNVGIGNTSPASKLDVTGLAIITNTAGGNNYDDNLRLPASPSGFASIALGAIAGTTGTGVGQWTILKYPSASSHKFSIRYNTADMFTILTNGNVGIGTNNPGDFLTVNGNASMSSAILYGDLLFKTYSTNPKIKSNFQNGTVTIVGGTTESTDPSITLYGSTHSSKPKMIAMDGQIAIGNTCVPSGYLVSVKGNIICEKLKVKPEGGNCWADYVFAPNYRLLKLTEVEAFIKKNKHLPGVPSAAEVDENGVEVVEMDATLLKKIEELTLYMIEQNKRLEKLEQENVELKKLVKQN